MSRPKKPGWFDPTPLPFSLPDSAAMELAEILEIDETTDDFTLMKTEVEKWLGSYPGWVKTMDDAPTDAAMAAVIRPLVKDAKKLIDGLQKIDGLSRSELGDAYRVELMDELCYFAGRAPNVCKKLEASESRGINNRKAARQHIIAEIGRLYCQYAKKPNRNGLLNFITDILDVAKIPYEDNDFRLLKNLPRL